MRWFRLTVISVVGAGLVLTQAPLMAQTPRDRLLAAKQTAEEANFRNDQTGLRDAIARFDELVSDAKLGVRALYWAGWSRWMLAASEIAAGNMADATRTLETAVQNQRRALELRPDDVETIAILGWTLYALAYTDRERTSTLMPEVTALRQRAVEAGPASPRVVVMDASMLFFIPAERGGGQDKAMARWLEGMKLLDAEHVADPVDPDWGRALFEGWLANLCINMTPPRKVEARAMAMRALELRPDFWWVRTVVVPQIDRTTR